MTTAIWCNDNWFLVPSCLLMAVAQARQWNRDGGSEGTTPARTISGVRDSHSCSSRLIPNLPSLGAHDGNLSRISILPDATMSIPDERGFWGVPKSHDSASSSASVASDRYLRREQG